MLVSCIQNYLLRSDYLNRYKGLDEESIIGNVLEVISPTAIYGILFSLSFDPLHRLLFHVAMTQATQRYMFT